MSRFRQANDRTIPFSDIKPERFEPVVSESQRAERRRVFMEEIPLPEELARERPRQLRGNK